MPWRAPPRTTSGGRRHPAAVDAGAHPAERIGHPAHGPPGDRLVAGQHRQAVESGGPPGEQTDPGAGVADIDDADRFVEPGRPSGHHRLAGRGRTRRHRRLRWRPPCAAHLGRSISRRDGNDPRLGPPGGGPGGRSTCRRARAAGRAARAERAQRRSRSSPVRPPGSDRRGGRHKPQPAHRAPEPALVQGLPDPVGGSGVDDQDQHAAVALRAVGDL